MIQSPKRFVTVNGAGHNDPGARAVAEAKQFSSSFRHEVGSISDTDL